MLAFRTFLLCGQDVAICAFPGNLVKFDTTAELWKSDTWHLSWTINFRVEGQIQTLRSLEFIEVQGAVGVLNESKSCSNFRWLEDANFLDLFSFKLDQ
jgi:hypothetical protein